MEVAVGCPGHLLLAVAESPERFLLAAAAESPERFLLAAAGPQAMWPQQGMAPPRAPARLLFLLNWGTLRVRLETRHPTLHPIRLLRTQYHVEPKTSC